ncbi:MAG TPA: hypothetical protein VFK40_03775 [Nitrososphaeraceae archaeon]|nr:hypothetical protein [Nitrososphaeraceae archaeon]
MLVSIERIIKNLGHNEPIIVATFKGFLALLSPNNFPLIADDLKIMNMKQI